MFQRPPAGTIPDAPGSYQFKDKDGRVIYVGKAHSLRSRLSNYFVNPSSLPPRTAQMVAAAQSVEWIQVRNDVEALMLEYSLIKQHRPRFNIRLRDDKSYPFLAITTGDEWPRAMVMRGKKRKDTRYFGPFGHAYAIRETLDLLLRTFPIRTCSDNKFGHHERLGRPCLLFHIEKCKGPCVGEVDHVEYERLVGQLIEFLDGDTQSVVHQLERQMREAADSQEYERAARLRDRLASVRKAIEKQTIVTETARGPRRHRDVGRRAGGGGPGLLRAAGTCRRAQGLHPRPGGGRVARRAGRPGARGPLRRGRAGGHPPPGAGARRAGRRRRVPRVPVRGPGLERVRSGCPSGATSGPCRPPSPRTPRRSSSATGCGGRPTTTLGPGPSPPSRTRSDLPDAPLRIECFDMSHIQGSDYVGSMVVMEDGLPKKSDYRRFRIKEVAGNDDFAAMEEVLTRRLTALIVERDRSLGGGGGSGRPRKFAYPPNLLVVDGGRGQLNVAQRVVESLGLEEEIAVAGLAKRFEEVYVPGQADPIRIPRQSEALYMLQRLRDEAHRFAITYHRELRGKRMTTSVLDGIKGLGETRRKRLVKELGGIKAVKEASLEELLALPWLPDAVGRAVYEKVHGLSGGSAPRVAPEGVDAGLVARREA